MVVKSNCELKWRNKITTPLVTITMPTYRAMPWIKAAVKSVLGQTFKDFRLAVLLDGSCSETTTYLQTIADPRLQIIRKDRTGYVDTCNTGIRICESPYLAMADSDDVNCADRLSKQVDLLEKNPNIAGVSSNCIYFVEDGIPCGTSKVFISPDEVSRDFLSLGVGFITCVAMYKTNVLRAVGGFRNGIGVAADSDLVLRLLEKYNLSNCPETLIWKRLRPDSMTNSDLFGNRLSHSFALACSVARLGGRKEPRWEDFLALRKSRRPLLRFIEWIDECSVVAYQKGVVARGCGKNVRSLLFKMNAAFLSPRRALRRLRIWS